ncbi:hypothetical protein BX600DRAFT_501843 [Xylariales sp. PMI_506]|nr:hypothetical protein BX600DRAFT_501843 [Xylariales sp. PMI_506]
MSPSHIVILGAGPAGLSAALALAKMSSSPLPSSATTNSRQQPPLRITVLELRPGIQTIGGAVNLTPLAMRYLDYLLEGGGGGGGEGEEAVPTTGSVGVDGGDGHSPSRPLIRSLRQSGHPVAAIDLVSMRNGRRLGSLWEGADALRVSRSSIVESLLAAARSWGGEKEGGAASSASPSSSSPSRARIEVRYGIKVKSIKEEEGDKVVLQLQSDPKADSSGVSDKDDEILVGDILLGCDGLHSFARRLYVEPDRSETYTGRAVAMGYADLREAGKTGVLRSEGGSSGKGDKKEGEGKEFLRSTCLIQGQRGSLLVSYFEPSLSRVYLASVTGMAEPSAATVATAADAKKDGDLRNGWKLLGSDGEALKKDVQLRYRGSGLAGLDTLVASCEEWNLYPVYRLPPGGRWRRGRVLLLGDAAHAMPPQGESTAFAIEDGILFARLFCSAEKDSGERRHIDRVFSDYESLRRPVIDRHYRSTVWGFESSNSDSSWLWALFMEYITMAYLAVQKWRQTNYLASDVRNIPLPN